MIISASRRTDIPAFYSEWFFNRLEEGVVYTQNPINRKQISKITLSPSVVDCIVFWTKNPASMLAGLDRLDAWGYDYYFQFTLTPYDTSLEPNVPPRANSSRHSSPSLRNSGGIASSGAMIPLY